jgi:hypothetical protein
MICCAPGALEDMIDRMEHFFITCLNPDLLQEKQQPQIKIYSTQPDEDKECFSCMNEYTTKTKLGILPCNHYCCYQCMNAWLQNNKTCPNCRREFSVNQLTESYCEIIEEEITHED